MVLPINIFAQNVSDKIIKIDNSVVVGKILRVNDNNVEIDPVGEIPFLIIKRSEINLIIYKDNTVVNFQESSTSEDLENSDNALTKESFLCLANKNDEIKMLRFYNRKSYDYNTKGDHLFFINNDHIHNYKGINIKKDSVFIGSAGYFSYSLTGEIEWADTLKHVFLYSNKIQDEISFKLLLSFTSKSKLLTKYIVFGNIKLNISIYNSQGNLIYENTFIADGDYQSDIENDNMELVPETINGRRKFRIIPILDEAEEPAIVKFEESVIKGIKFYPTVKIIPRNEDKKDNRGRYTHSLKYIKTEVTLNFDDSFNN
jgi:hypothetical protein